MGLGLPICMECKTYLLFNRSNKGSSWFCGRHGEEDDSYKISYSLCRDAREILSEIDKRSKYGFVRFKPGREIKREDIK